ncbi:PDDEXK family nuclease [Lacticaseibacillus nasuensis]|uniref:hypothetical protein n=1 Tax=Lacticaseibacillus nasuensis TaxID=944671 RepID=UPI00396A7D04
MEYHSQIMFKIRFTAGKAETLFGENLCHSRLRYWRNYKTLPAMPDVAITKSRRAMFIDGEFWNGYDSEESEEASNSNQSRKLIPEDYRQYCA